MPVKCNAWIIPVLNDTNIKEDLAELPGDKWEMEYRY